MKRVEEGAPGDASAKRVASDTFESLGGETPPPGRAAVAYAGSMTTFVLTGVFG